ncbi:pH-sensitive chloride channel 1 isoform X7 [Bombus vancouverensis nearcticus]|uniref:glycine receptor subunit alpha-4 isoform X7 n=1 Tax=Bombus flavifrons TaxID=103934 RepID=UPI0037037438
MGWVALGRCAGGGGRLSSVLSLSLTSLASSLIFTILCILTLALTLVTLVRAEDIFEEGKSDKEILDNLLLSTRYDKRLLPPVQGTLRPPPHTRQDDYTPDYLVPNDPDHPEHLEHHRHRYHHTAPHNHSSLLTPRRKGTLTVNVSVLLLSLASPDESSLKYEVEFLLQQQWYDPRLRYSNRSQYEYLNAIHHYDDIWLPDTYFIMHGDFKDPLIPVHFALRIYRNGTVNYLMRRHLILSCQGRLNIFPFDDPLCSFAIESISYEQSAITYVWKNDEGTLRKSPSLTSLNAYLIKNQTITCPIKVSWRGNYSCLKVDLIFTRDRAFYFTTVFIPGIILVTSSFITFWLEWNAVPARVMIGVTTMLNFFTTSNGFRSTLPVVSNLTAMNVWDGVCMCFIYASLLEFVCVNYVGRKRPMHNVVYRPGENPVTQRLPAVLSRIGIILASPLGKKKREGGPPTGATTGPNEIVTCTNCGPNPCTHTTTNGCTAELRKKEPPHPIRVAKTIDVIARITFPVAYFMFLTFFFIHYKGTS